MPWWLPIAIVVSTVFSLWMLFPKSYLEQTLSAQKTPNAASLAYLHLLVRANPKDNTLRLKLADMALAAQNASLAHSALGPWMHSPLRGLALPIAQARLRLLRLELLSTPLHTPTRDKLQQQYIHSLTQIAAHLSPLQLLNEAGFAIQLGDYASAACLDRRILETGTASSLRLKAYQQGIDALLAADEPRAALAFARAYLNRVPRNEVLWRRLTRLALAANRPDLAVRYARRLVGLPEPAG